MSDAFILYTVVFGLLVIASVLSIYESRALRSDAVYQPIIQQPNSNHTILLRLSHHLRIPHCRILNRNIAVSLEAEANEIRDVSDYERILAVGDLHGSYDELLRILIKAHVTDSDGNWIAMRTILISLGDLIDRGPQSLKVQLSSWIKHSRILQNDS